MVLAVLLLGGLLIYWQIVQPWQRVHTSLRRLATRDFSSVPLPETAGIFKGAIHDVREIADLLKQLDRQITDEGFSLRAILSSMVEGVLIADRSQRVRLYNEALLRLFALTDSPLNRPVIEVFRKHELQNALEAALREGLPQEIEISIAVPGQGGGSITRHLTVNVAALTPKPRSRAMAALVVFHDVTAIRELEARQRELLANVSHEFRTPLAIINGYVETLMDGALEDPEMTQRSLQAMHKNSRRLSLLIDDLLTMSRLEDRARLLTFVQAPLRVVLATVLENLEPRVAARCAEVVIEWPDDPLVAEIDTLRIEQVFSNLIDNALRYGGVNDLKITIAACPKGSEICLTFSDNGLGIPLGDQAHIFERFYRVHKDRSRDAGGTGLGLSIVKNIVEAHGGHVSVASHPGAGSTFYVCLPVSQNLSGPN